MPYLYGKHWAERCLLWKFRMENPPAPLEKPWYHPLEPSERHPTGEEMHGMGMTSLSALIFVMRMIHYDAICIATACSFQEGDRAPTHAITQILNMHVVRIQCAHTQT